MQAAVDRAMAREGREVLAVVLVLVLAVVVVVAAVVLMEVPLPPPEVSDQRVAPVLAMVEVVAVEEISQEASMMKAVAARAVKCLPSLQHPLHPCPQPATIGASSGCSVLASLLPSVFPSFFLLLLQLLVFSCCFLFSFLSS
jgi:hypothetical protein